MRKYQYFAVVAGKLQLDNPMAVFRRWEAHGATNEEFFSHRLIWERGTMLRRISRGEAPFVALEVRPRLARHYVRMYTARFKKSAKENLAPRYQYFAIVPYGFTRKIPYALVRTWGQSDEEYFSPQSAWEGGDILDRILAGTMDATSVSIEEWQAKRCEEVLNARFSQQQDSMPRGDRHQAEPPHLVKRDYVYYVIVGKGYPREEPFALVRRWGGENSANEEYFSRRLKWERDTILDDISRGSMNRDAVTITEAEVEHYVAQLTRRFEENEKDRHGWRS